MTMSMRRKIVVVYALLVVIESQSELYRSAAASRPPPQSIDKCVRTNNLFLLSPETLATTEVQIMR